jgi:ACS family sodium-dependent inorganic phosphate cotransporter
MMYNDASLFLCDIAMAAPSFSLGHQTHNHRHSSSSSSPHQRMMHRHPLSAFSSPPIMRYMPRSSPRLSSNPISTTMFGHERLSQRRHHHGCAAFVLYSKLSLEDGTAADGSMSIMSNTTLQSTTGKDGDVTVNDKNNSKRQQLPREFIPILILCFVVTLLSALDRVAMSIAILPLSSEFSYSETIKGQISSAVSYGYGLAILPIGLAVSVVSSRLLMSIGVLLWSIATLGTPLAAELSSNGGVGDESTMFILPLLAVRAIMGAAEAVVLPTMQRILSTWVPPERKAGTFATILAGFQFGTVSAYLVSPLVMDAMSGIDGGSDDSAGWRGLFYVYGLAGLLWLVPWSVIAKDAPTTVANADCEETLVNSMIEDDASLVWKECDIDGKITAQSTKDDVKSLLQSAPWNAFFTSRGVWAMTLAHAGKNWLLYNLLAWTPTFYSEQYGLNVKESALFSVLPSVCGMIGGLTAGNLADYVLVKLEEDKTDGKSDDEKRTQVRKLIQGTALLGPAACLTLLSDLPENAATAQLLLGGAVGLQSFDVAGFGAATQDKAGKRWAGLLYSLTSLPGVLIGSVSVSVTGQILDAMSDTDGGWSTVFQLNAAICVAGALCFLLLYDSKREFE